MYCPKCGKLNKEGAKFCAFCGEELFPEKIKLTKKTGIIGLIIVGFILVLILNPFGHNSSVRNSPSATVKNYFEAFEKGEYSKARNCLYSPALALGEFTVSDFNEAKSGINDLGGIKKIDITKEKIEGETAEVCYEIEFGNGDKQSDCGPLIREGGAWKIAE